MGGVGEALFHVEAGLGACFYVCNVVCFGETLSFFGGYFTSRYPSLLDQVDLIPNEQQRDSRRRVVPGFIKPVGNVLEGRPVSHVKHQQGSGRPAIVRPGDTPEVFLSSLCVHYRVPNLQFDRLAVNGDDASSELHPNGHIVVCPETLVSELQ